MAYQRQGAWAVVGQPASAERASVPGAERGGWLDGDDLVAKAREPRRVPARAGTHVEDGAHQRQGTGTSFVASPGIMKTDANLVRTRVSLIPSCPRGSICAVIMRSLVLIPGVGRRLFLYQICANRPCFGVVRVRCCLPRGLRPSPSDAR